VRTINAHLLTYGEQPSGVVTLERRYGPRRLRDDDDDDDEACSSHTDESENKASHATEGICVLDALPVMRTGC